MILTKKEEDYATPSLPERKWYYRFDQAEGSSSCAYRLPDCAVVGYVPYLNTVSLLPRGSIYRKLRWRPAFRFLFRSGNPAPPDYLDFEASLPDFLRRRHYRCALWLRDIQVQVSGKRVELSFICGHQIGYTPLVGNIFLPGDGAMTPHAAFVDGRVVLTVMLRFKLGKLSNLGSRILTGHMAPSAWAQLEYGIWDSGLCELQFQGSSVPSQKLYVGQSAVYHYDMLASDQGAVVKFIKAGDCSNAPGRQFPLMLPWIEAQAE